MAISCDTSGDEYYMTNRVFDLTSGSAGKKRLVAVLYICSIGLNKEEGEEISCCFDDIFGWHRRV